MDFLTIVEDEYLIKPPYGCEKDILYLPDLLPGKVIMGPGSSHLG